jgi:hypothetical protein
MVPGCGWWQFPQTLATVGLVGAAAFSCATACPANMPIVRATANEKVLMHFSNMVLSSLILCLLKADFVTAERRKNSGFVRNYIPYMGSFDIKQDMTIRTYYNYSFNISQQV